MTVSIEARFYQRTAGAPLQATSTDTLTGTSDFSQHWRDGFGVKATSATPTNISEFAEHAIYQQEEAMDWSRTEIKQRFEGNTFEDSRLVVSYGVKKTLDADWAVGKYVFAVATIDEGVIVKASPPYRIR